MFEGFSPIVQALQGTLFTWGLTALGAATAIFIRGNHRIILDSSLGFAGGVMLAASYWSLLEPALEMAASMETYGKDGEWSFIPVAVGFFLGALFVYGAELVMNHIGVENPVELMKKDRFVDDPTSSMSVTVEEAPRYNLRKRKARSGSNEEGLPEQDQEGDVAIKENSTVDDQQKLMDTSHWRRILLLIIAITVHNIPEGLAVGVGFGAVGRTKSATFESARNLALGIGIQNFPEGLSVSLPLKAAGFSTWKAIWYGQLSGIVEPIAGVIGAALVTWITPILPYALAFAAGAMVYVVVDDIVPESQAAGNGKAASWGVVIGFIVMMSLDVGLG